MADRDAQVTKDEATGGQISGGHLVAKALKHEGVDTIFTLCGGHIIDIYDGCLDEGIKIVDVLMGTPASLAGQGVQWSLLGPARPMRSPASPMLSGPKARCC
jgi:hypothetical protein